MQFFYQIIGYLFYLTNHYKDTVTKPLEAQINLLKDQLEVAQRKEPLAVAEDLERRVKITEGELERQRGETKEQAEVLNRTLERLGIVEAQNEENQRRLVELERVRKDAIDLAEKIRKGDKGIVKYIESLQLKDSEESPPE